MFKVQTVKIGEGRRKGDEDASPPRWRWSADGGRQTEWPQTHFALRATKVGRGRRSARGWNNPEPRKGRIRLRLASAFAFGLRPTGRRDARGVRGGRGRGECPRIASAFARPTAGQVRLRQAYGGTGESSRMPAKWVGGRAGRHVPAGRRSHRPQARLLPLAAAPVPRGKPRGQPSARSGGSTAARLRTLRFYADLVLPPQPWLGRLDIGFQRLMEGRVSTNLSNLHESMGVPRTMAEGSGDSDHRFQMTRMGRVASATCKRPAQHGCASEGSGECPQASLQRILRSPRAACKARRGRSCSAIRADWCRFVDKMSLLRSLCLSRRGLARGAIVSPP